MSRTQADREFDWETGRELERKDAEIDDLREALTFVRAERDHWRALVPLAERVKHPFRANGQTTR